MKKITMIIVPIVVILAIVLAITHHKKDSQETITQEVVQGSVTEIASESEIETMPAPEAEPVVWQFGADLQDVTGGDASGFVQTAFLTDTGEFYLEGVFSDLPDLENGYFYEGWIVRRGDDRSVLSTGALEFEGEGMYTNLYIADEDQIDHTFYVLTLEPDDGDPAPADHVLQGDLIPLQ